MAGGLAALLDDVAVIAKMASVAGTKAAAVVIDDAAVTPQYVRGFDPKRELPIIWRIARGSLANKAILIVLLLLLDYFLPVVMTPLLMAGGLYLCFEGAEKLWEKVAGHHDEDAAVPVAEMGQAHEKSMIRGAITTDFILSAEIMVISLNTLNEAAGASLSLWQKSATLAVVGILITILVYGVVALIVKMDDVGLAMMQRPSTGSQKVGRTLVDLMPKILVALSTIGVAAMLWVGGHILIDGAHKLGWHLPHDLIHHLAEPAKHVAAVGPFLDWLVDTICSAIFGLILGAIVVVVLHLLPLKKTKVVDGADPH